MTIFTAYHNRIYPLSSKKDSIVLLYQCCYGKNVISSIPQETAKNTSNLYDPISSDLVRIHVDAYLAGGFSLKTLQAMAKNVADIPFDEKRFNDLLASHACSCPATIAHSLDYIHHYHPNYIIVFKKDLSVDMIAYQFNQFLKKQPPHSIIALEGKCGSGKTTLSSLIQPGLRYSVIPMDDFFLPDTLRTPMRFQESGGNIHYELVSEVLSTFQQKKLTHYLAYDCTTNTYRQKDISPQSSLLLEGVYSYHPFFRKFVNRLIYLDINEEKQLERIKQRKLADRFFREWIPLENDYFEKEKIVLLADLIL